MAQMLPSEPIRICNEPTEGEKYFFYMLKEYLPDEIIVFYNLPINDFRQKDYHADFTIIIPSIGLIVLEAKDWSIDYIIRSNSHKYYVKKYEEVDNPKIQAMRYMKNIEDELRNEKSLLKQFGSYRNRLIFPRAHGVVFTHITRKEYEESNHYRSIDPSFILFSEDLKRIKDFHDTAYLLDKLSKMFKHTFLFPTLSSEQMQCIRKLLYKESGNDIVEKESEIISGPDSSDNTVFKSSVSEVSVAADIIDTIPQQVPPEITVHTDKPAPKPYKYPGPPISKGIIIGFLLTAFMAICVQKVMPNINAFVANFKGRSTALSNKDIEDKIFMSFKVKEKYTYIFFGDPKRNNINYENKKCPKGTTIDFYENKKVIVTDPAGKKTEYQYDLDILYIEVANSYTEAYYNGEEITKGKKLGFIRYIFSEGKLIKGWDI